MKIAIFNRLDIKNPRSGGAEVFTYEVAKRWVSQGHEVSLLVSNFKGGKTQEVINGINVLRFGNIFTVDIYAKKYYNKHLKGNIDIIIDEYTYKPFLTPKYAKEPVICLVHELAREKYFYELPPIFSHLCYYYFEPHWLKNYKDCYAVTVSNSTKSDLIDLGFNNIHIVPEGINFKAANKVPKKEETPTILFVGLLKKVNLVDHAIKSLEIISKKIPDARLWIVGRGTELNHLKKIAKGLNVKFWGYVDDDKKLELMQRSNLLLVPAVREGWGLVVSEANASGTPAIGYNVPGLRDSIIHNKTGILTENNPISIAKEVIRFFSETDLNNKLTKNALELGKTFDWENTASTFMDVIEKSLNDNITLDIPIPYSMAVSNNK